MKRYQFATHHMKRYQFATHHIKSNIFDQTLQNEHLWHVRCRNKSLRDQHLLCESPRNFTNTKLFRGVITCSSLVTYRCHLTWFFKNNYCTFKSDKFGDQVVWNNSLPLFKRFCIFETETCPQNASSIQETYERQTPEAKLFFMHLLPLKTFEFKLLPMKSWAHTLILAQEPLCIWRVFRCKTTSLLRLFLHAYSS